jgi:hypothetical protein
MFNYKDLKIKMSTVNTLPTTVASLLIALAVVISGTHAKDFATVTLLSDTKKVDDFGSHIVKIAGELHNHVDKIAKVQPSADTGSQADTRSLRLLHDKKEATLRGRITDRLRLWWQLNTLYLG